MQKRFFDFRSFLARSGFNQFSIRLVKCAGVISSACLCACTVLTNPPSRPTNDDITDNLTYRTAYAYLARARTGMQTDVMALENQDATNKGMVAGGVAGAGVAALFKGSTDLVLSLLTVGGLGYVTNQNVQPATRIGIYRAGLANLDCIDDAASGLNLHNLRLKEARNRLTRKIDRVDNAIRAGRNDPVHGSSLKTVIDNADNAARAAGILGAQIDGTVNIDDRQIGRQVYSLVNQTVMSVSQQLNASSPSIDAVAQTSSIGSFVSAHQDAKTQGKSTAATTQDALTTVQRTVQSAHPPWFNELQASLNELNIEVSVVQSLLANDVISTAAIGACKTIAPGTEPIRILVRENVPPDGVPLQAGETYNFEVTGDATGTPRIGWAGPEPAIAQLIAQYSEGKLQIMAPPNTRPGHFTIYLYDASSRDATHRASNKIDIHVAPVAVVTPSPPVPRKEPIKNPGAKKGNGIAIPPPPDLSAGPAVGTGGVKLTELGLPPDVQPTDQRYIDRVKKLEQCTGLAQTGKMNDALQARLKKMDPINANGDCPAVAGAGTARASSDIAKPVTH